MHTHSFIIGEAIKTWWNKTKKYFWILILLLAISNLPSFIMNSVASIFSHIPWATIMVRDSLQNIDVPQTVGIRSIIENTLLVITSIFSLRLSLWYIKTNLMAINDQKPAVKDLWYASWRHVLRLIGASFLVWLATIIGLIALIVPGIIIGVRLSMYKYLIAEWYGVMDAIKTSRSMTSWHVWKLIGVYFVQLGVLLLGVITLLVWLLWAIPTVNLSHAYIYLQLKKNIKAHPAKEHM